ncbi:MAG: hypothetical protein ABL893_19780, partial [Hyphomicrobium sp.]
AIVIAASAGSAMAKGRHGGGHGGGHHFSGMGFSGGHHRHHHRPHLYIYSGGGGCGYFYEKWQYTGRFYWKSKYYQCKGWW